MNQQEVEGLFYSAAETQAVAVGYRLGNGADAAMKLRAKEAAGTIFRVQRSEEERDLDIEHGVRAFRVVVDMMVALRREVYRDQAAKLLSKIIGQDILDLVIEKLCPGLFPFC